MRLNLLGSLAITLLMGCAKIGLEPASSSDRVVGTDRTLVPSKTGSSVEKTVAVADLSIHAVRLCNRMEADRISTTIVNEKVNKSVWLDATLAILGGAAVIAGIVVLVDAQNVYPDDETSRTYNSTGPELATAGGVTLVGGGGVSLIIPIVDVFRGIGTEETEERSRAEAVVAASNVPCDKVVPFENVSVTIKAPNKEDVELGETDAEGSLDVNLIEAIPRDWVVGSDPAKKADLLVGDKKVGVVRLEIVRAHHERDAWESSQIDKCREPELTTDCDLVERYTMDFPDGAAVNEALDTLFAARPILKQKEEELQQRLEEERRAEEARRAAEAQAEAAAAARAREQQQQAARRAQCQAKCRSACAGNANCVAGCVRSTCQ